MEPIFVTRIEDSMGNVLGEFNNQKREAVSEYTAYLMANLMQGVVNSGTGVRLRAKYGLKGEIAGKTGTTNDQSDGWFIGYTPSLTAGVWVGAEDRQVHFESLTLGGGSNMALPIWGIFMQKVLQDGTLGVYETDRFVKPMGVTLNLDCDGSDEDAVAKVSGNYLIFYLTRTEFSNCEADHPAMTSVFSWGCESQSKEKDGVFSCSVIIFTNG